MPIERSRRTMRKVSSMMDIINTTMGMVIMICGVLILIDSKENEGLFPIVFLAAAIMNGLMGVKYHMRRDRVRSIALFVSTVFLVALCIVGVVGIWF